MKKVTGIHQNMVAINPWWPGLLAAGLLLAWPITGQAEVSSHTNSEFVATPVNLSQTAIPQVMITSSNDHQLFFKAYNDYSDLDGDGSPETTYKHSFTYYGYFDSGKCYDYSVANLRFEPQAVTADKYCTGANDAYWSGNFLNWISMSRIDIIRKVLFGGHRRVDTAASTVLERAYLPHDAHSWAKYYDGKDLADLTPFTLDNTGTSATVSSVSAMTTSATSLAIAGAGNQVFTVADAGAINNGDYVVAQVASDSGKYMQGNATVAGATVTINVTGSAGAGTYADWKLFPRKQFSYSGGTWANNDWVRVERTSDPSIFMNGQILAGGGVISLYVREAGGVTATTYNDWRIVHLQESGITFCNTTDVNGRIYSENATEPPLIKVVRGNYSLWAGNERWQCTWRSGASYDNHSAGNANNIEQSGIHSYSDNPTYGAGLGQKNYVARVQACVAGLLGDEKCKQYPNGNYKPIGLLQTYGDDDQMYFGMIAGTYNKHVAGGEVIRNIGSMSDEINVNSDGTFKLVAVAAGGSVADNSSEGLINAWSLYRIKGYYNSSSGEDSGDYGTYNKSQGDNCPWGLAADFSSSDPVMADNRCQNWGNPFAEIFLQAIRYFADGGVAGVFRSNSSTGITGLPQPLPWSDPLDDDNYCARLSVVNMNSSLLSFDSDELDGISYGVKSIWDNDDLPGDKTSKAMTDVVGAGEGIHGKDYFVGEVSGDTNGLCTEKTVASLGDALGLCPELPRMRGSYRIAGLAHYAQTKDIRPGLQGDQTLDFYAVAMASAVPALEIPHPVTGNLAVTILPACRNTSLSPNGNCAIVDFKLVQQTINNGNNVGTGKIYVNWEDSEQGGDYDQDMWGVLEYRLDVGAGTIEVTTNVIAESTIYDMGFGYVISGTSQDGFHAHSGIEGYTYDDPATIIAGSDCAAGCQVGNAASTARYTMGAATASLLKDPLWYAAKWGNFSDSDGDGTPNLAAEWDRLNNDTGAEGADGIPDAYFYASNPAKLEDALNRVFLAILQRVSSGTAAAVVSNNVSGEGALYQAFYEPSRLDAAGNEATWLGTVQAIWLDSYGYLREDGNGNAQLDNYDTDRVIEFFYDEVNNKTRVRRFTSTNPTTFTPQYMQGKVTAYNSATGELTFTVDEISGSVGAGPYSDWRVYNLSNGRQGSSTTSSTLAPADHGEKPFTVAPTTAWISVEDTVLVAYYAATVMELEDVGTLWNAREQLNDITHPTDQRTYGFADSGRRYIKTWIDTNLDGVVQAAEYIDFQHDHATITGNYGFFDQLSAATAQELVRYIRGEEIAGSRNRSVNYDGSGVKVMRLGDIVNSTPVVVAAPQERFDLLTGDASYKTFYRQYRTRRNVLYVGANDGMLHAFNAGFYTSGDKEFSVNGKKHDGITDAAAHALGSELWAYVPMNLLPHLKWLKNANYEHVYYMDGKPRIFDAKVFSKDDDHPGLGSDSKGWGTIMVAGMRLGGGPMTIDTAANGLGNPNAADDRTMRSAWVIMDITNPEAEPKLLAEIQIPDGSFTTSSVEIMTFKDKNSADDENKWYLMFGSGPDLYDGATNLMTAARSVTTAKIYLMDLDQLENPGGSPTAPAGCTVKSVSSGINPIKMFECDTGVNNSFIGGIGAVDWNNPLNYKADTIYFGLVGDASANTGRVMKMEVKESGVPAGNIDPADDWGAMTTLIQTNQPLVSPPNPGLDDLGNKWIFFGTGRLYVQADHSSTTSQSLYGIKDSGTAVARADLFDATNVKVFSDGSLTGATDPALDTLAKVKQAIDEETYRGWYLDLPPIYGAAGTDPATRSLSESVLIGGVVFSSVYQPSVDQCSGEGFSRLYGLYYKTGTGYDSPTVFGLEEDESSITFINLGRGFATTPALHSGSGKGGSKVSAFVQMSTGTITATEAGLLTGEIRSGRESWRER